MPYPNEHAARLRSPKDFEDESFRRKKDGTIYGRIKVPSSVSVIWAKLKGKSKPSDNPLPQALRFPTSSWTAEAAKKWLKTNNVKYIAFEPAKSKDKNSAPMRACVFESADVSLFKEGDDDDRRFHIVAYSGGVIPNHFFWGNVMFDLEGIKFAKAKTPVLQEHVTKDRIGFSTKQDIDDKIVIDGRFLDNQSAQELRGDMIKGFPMQASVFLPPTAVEYIKEGETTEVNGKTLKGPGTVFRKGKIHEVSMCVMGADGDTVSKAYSQDENSQIQFSIEKEQVMTETNEIPELTAESFATQYPDLQKQIVATAKEKAEADVVNRYKKIAEVCGDDHKLAGKLFVEGKGRDDALQAKNAALTAEMTQMKKDAETATGTSTGTQAAEQEFSDEQKKRDEGKADDNTTAEGEPATFDAAVEKTMREVFSQDVKRSGQKMTRAEAIRFCVEKYPALHKKLKEENTREPRD